MAGNNLLTPSNVESWLKNMQRGIFELTKEMEAKEDWTVDAEQAAELLGLTAAKLRDDPEYLLAAKPDQVSLDNLIYLLGHLPTSQAFRVLNLAVKKQEDITALLSKAAQMHCAERSDLHPESRVMIDRLMVIIRWRCFSLVFGPKRRSDILSILEQSQN